MFQLILPFQLDLPFDRREDAAPNAPESAETQYESRVQPRVRARKEQRARSFRARAAAL